MLCCSSLLRGQLATRMEHITVHAIYLLSIAVDLANAAVEELKSKNKQGKTIC